MYVYMRMWINVSYIPCLSIVYKQNVNASIVRVLTPCLNIYNALQHYVDEKLSLVFPIDIQ